MHPWARPVTNIRNTTSLAGMAEARRPLPGSVQQLRRIRAGAEAGNEKEGRGVVRA